MSQQPWPRRGRNPPFATGAMRPCMRSVPPFVGSLPSRLPYNITTVPATQHFVPTTIVYPNQLPADASGGSAVPGMQRFCTPVQQMPIHAFNSVPMGQRAPIDPVLTLEEQRKIEKERNFQMQQERLRQFTIAGKRGSLNADNLLDSMFGKPEMKKQSVKSVQGEKSTTVKDSASLIDKAEDHPALSRVMPTTVPIKQDDPPLKIGEPKTKEKAQKDPKELENMMMECSNFTGPQKARLFQKPAVKELPKANTHRTEFSASERAVDWRSIQGLDNVFSAPKPRFPRWCCKEGVPPLFLQVQNIVTANGNQPPDTEVLYPILISSGLPQRLLGEIWEMVDQTSPGSLTVEEMYAALALIAVAQAGHQIKSPDILHQLPSCPIPNLQCFNAPQSAVPPVSSAASVPDHSAAAVPKESIQTEAEQMKVAPHSRPSSISTHSENLVGSIIAWSPFSNNTESTGVVDDDFDDFKSHTPMAVNAPPLIETFSSACDDEFDDFKQAPSVSQPPVAFPKLGESTQSNSVKSTPSLSTSSKAQVADSDLMLPEDKYSVFRMLQQDVPEVEIDTAEDSRSMGLSTRAESQELLLEKEKIVMTNAAPLISSMIDAADDDFGDFLDAGTTPVPSPKITRSKPEQSQPPTLNEDFADFSNLDSNMDFPKADTLKNDMPLSGKTANSDDDDFGEFAAFQASTLKPDMGLDYFSSSSKDNISLAESQSISSLEFGTFEVIGHGNDLRTSLSRQGSIPSLDLKVPALEPTENGDGFGDMQSADVGTTASPSLSADTSEHSDEKVQISMNGLSFPPSLNVPLVDKYSVIRSEQIFNEDLHVSEWTRCVQSSLEILQNATKIFNQMSCSSVCNEVLSTEEGKNYISNVVEVYKVVCRIAFASKSYEKQNNQLQQLIKDSEQAFNTLSVFLAGSPLLPDESSLNFTSSVLKADSDNGNACGVCLLNVDSRSKTFNKTDELMKLTYGQRQYHCACANLWVNCVDPLLPVLTLPQLI